MSNHKQILQKDFFDKQDIITLLSLDKDQVTDLFDKSSEIKQKYVGNKVFYRGLIEFSNMQYFQYLHH